MPSATLTIPAAPEQARTARLVAGAAARRAGVDPDAIDDVRLAVAEAVARAVLRSVAAGDPGEGTAAPGAEVTIAMRDDGSTFVIEVADTAPADLSDDDEQLALSIMRALAAQSSVADNEHGGQTVVLSWPVEPE